MTARILILALVLLALLLMACGPGDEWAEWQQEVLERQRRGLPADTPTTEAQDVDAIKLP